MLAQRMGMPLSELSKRMSSAEFSLHIALEIKRNNRSRPQEAESDWCDMA
jgi:hypothetical protein